MISVSNLAKSFGSQLLFEDAAFQLNPYFAGNRGRDFDFLYLGAWESGSEMGSDMSNYMTNHPDVGAAWEEVVDCASLMFASSWIQAPATGDDGEFMVTMSDCTVGHGHSNAQAVGALARYNAYRVENGMTVGTITWWPVLGGGEDEFDFKLVNVFDGPQHFGDHFSWYTDNQVYNVQGPMMRGTVDCDTSRAYIGRTIMNNMN